MDKQLFFAVWDLSELRMLIKSFMFKGYKSSNYYNYVDGDLACYYGYFELIKKKTINIHS